MDNRFQNIPEDPFLNGDFTKTNNEEIGIRKRIEKYEEERNRIINIMKEQNLIDPELVAEQKPLVEEAIEQKKENELQGPVLVKKQREQGRSRMVAYADVFAIIFAVSVVGLVTVLTMLLFINGIK